MSFIKYYKCNKLKIDLLGLKCLSIIDKSLELINRKVSEPIKSIYDVPLDDKKTYEMLSSGDVKGIFQLEGNSIAPYVSKCNPKTIDDIGLILAVIR